MCSSVSYVVRTSTFTPARSSSAAMSRVASMPSRSGMRMSMTIRSARADRASSTASRPVPASATTSMSRGRLDEHREGGPYEVLVVGEQYADRSSGLVLPGQRQRGGHLEALRRAPVPPSSVPPTLRARSRISDKPEPRRAARTHRPRHPHPRRPPSPVPVVRDASPAGPSLRRAPHDPLCIVTIVAAPVPYGVGERLLDDPVGGGAHRGRYAVRVDGQFDLGPGHPGRLRERPSPSSPGSGPRRSTEPNPEPSSEPSPEPGSPPAPLRRSGSRRSPAAPPAWCAVRRVRCGRSRRCRRGPGRRPRGRGVRGRRPGRVRRRTSARRSG